MGDLISDCITSGVKLAIHQQQAFVWNKRSRYRYDEFEKTIVGVRITSDSGDGLSCSSEEVAER
jgi:hypothetical protein